MPRTPIKGVEGTGMIRVDASEVYRALDRMEGAISSTGLAEFLMNDVDDWLKQRASARFAGRGDSAVGIWGDLKAGTQRLREYHGYNPRAPINKRQGRLENFVTRNPNPVVGPSGDGAFMIWPGPSPDPVTAKKYTTAQQGGSGRMPNGAPTHTSPRPVVGLDDIDGARILIDLQRHILSRMAGGVAVLGV